MILLIAEGQSPHAVAQEGLLKRRDPDTVYGWLDRHERQGLGDCRAGVMEATAAVPFAEREAVVRRPQQGPGQEGPGRSRCYCGWPAAEPWTLVTIRASFESIREYALSGI